MCTFAITEAVSLNVSSFVESSQDMVGNRVGATPLLQGPELAICRGKRLEAERPVQFDNDYDRWPDRANLMRLSAVRSSGQNISRR
jgi:hypothetical protein